MDPTDLLSDPHPPRYAYESDDEDEFDDASQISPSLAPVSDFDIIGEFNKGLPLVIASGDAGNAWARGASLGEQKGAVFVDKTQVGLLFNYAPETDGNVSINVLVSEANAILPINAMHSYAILVLESFRPSRVTVLDKYSAASYIANSKIDYDSAPVRYLSTARSLDHLILSSDLKPFRPPNLIQTIAAAFLSILEMEFDVDSCPGMCILLPSIFFSRATRSNKLQVISQAFQSLENSEDTDMERWHLSLMKNVHNVLVRSTSDRSLPYHESWAWALQSQSISTGKERKRMDYDEGMYI